MHFRSRRTVQFQDKEEGRGKGKETNVSIQGGNFLHRWAHFGVESTLNLKRVRNIIFGKDKGESTEPAKFLPVFI